MSPFTTPVASHEVILKRLVDWTMNLSTLHLILLIVTLFVIVDQH